METALQLKSPETAIEVSERRIWHNRKSGKVAENLVERIAQAKARNLLKQTALGLERLVSTLVIDVASEKDIKLVKVEAREESRNEMQRTRTKPADAENWEHHERITEERGPGFQRPVRGDIWIRNVVTTQVVFDGLPLKRRPFRGAPSEEIASIVTLDNAPLLPLPVYDTLSRLETILPVEDSKIVLLRPVEHRDVTPKVDPILCVKVYDCWFSVMRWEE